LKLLKPRCPEAAGSVATMSREKENKKRTCVMEQIVIKKFLVTD
jgi:hypothetical protein